MLEALLLGGVAQSSLLLSDLLVYWVKVPRTLVGIMAGFGAGALVAAISFDLIPEAEHLDNWELGVWMFVGAAIFLGGDFIVEKRFGEEGVGGSMGIVLATLFSSPLRAISAAAVVAAIAGGLIGGTNPGGVNGDVGDVLGVNSSDDDNGATVTPTSTPDATSTPDVTVTPQATPDDDDDDDDDDRGRNRGPGGGDDDDDDNSGPGGGGDDDDD
jgi:hypothetical protein